MLYSPPRAMDGFEALVGNCKILRIGRLNYDLIRYI